MVTGPNEVKVGNIYFELQAKNDMEVIFWQIWGFAYTNSKFIQL